jgi:tetratricopeptide (TPR) repeat protein
MGAGRETLELALARLEAGERQEGGELLARATIELTVAVQADPVDAEAHFLLGRALSFARRDDAALAAWQRVLELQPAHKDALYSRAMLLGERKEWLLAAQAWAELARHHPDSEVARWNEGQSLQLAGEAAEARAIFEDVLRRRPEEWGALAKLVQLAQAQGDHAARDAWLAQLYALRDSGTLPSLSEARGFVRDQFQESGRAVIVFESFALEGETAKLWVFALSEPGTGQSSGHISLGSYEATTQFARESGAIGPEERMYHLDGYPPDGSHQSYWMGAQRPTYDELRAHVVEILQGQVP